MLQLGNLKLNQITNQLKYLDLSFCIANDGVLDELISSCQSLEKLSLKNVSLSAKLINGIAKNGETFKVLNLEGCRGLVLNAWDIKVTFSGRGSEISSQTTLDFDFL